jgi:hypothetical protein
VLPANWTTVQTFLRCATQWQYAGMAGVRVGLHYPGVAAVLRLTVPKADRAAVFAGLQVMEYAAVAELALHSERNAKPRR